MKKNWILVLLATAFVLIFSACSKSSDKKPEFFATLETLVTEAENNYSLDKVDSIKEKFSEFLSKNQNIIKEKNWSDGDTEKMNSLINRFNAVTNLSTYADDYTNSFIFDETEESFSSDFILEDLGLEDELNFGGSVENIENTILGDLIPSGTSSIINQSANDLFGDLSLDGLSGLSSSLDLGFDGLTIPSFNFSDDE